MVKLLAVPGIQDTQCGFKLFERRAYEYVFSRQRLDGFAFDVEILRIAMLGGFRIAEVPVNWRHVPGSKIELVRDSARMLADVLRIPFMHRRPAGPAR